MIGDAMDLRLGTWQRAFRVDEGPFDALITDGPYSAKTHTGHNAARSNDGSDRRQLGYGHLTPRQVRSFVRHWSPRCRGWFLSITDHVLMPVWEKALADQGRYVFAGLPLIIPGMTVRQTGDGPAREAVYLVAARPRNKEFASWGSLRGFYTAAQDRWSKAVGGKPLPMMEALVRDYTRPGDHVVDPFAGWGTTLLACARNGRFGYGAEVNPADHAGALVALGRAWTPDLIEVAARMRLPPPAPATQGGLVLVDALFPTPPVDAGTDNEAT